MNKGDGYADFQRPKIRKQEIIESAKQLFFEKGIANTSMIEIAAANGVAKGLVYYYFSSKDDLVNEVINTIVEEVNQKLEEIIASKFDFHEKLSRILDVYFHSIAEHPSIKNLSPGQSEIYLRLKERLSEAACLPALQLVQEGMTTGILKLKYPEYIVKIIIKGIGDIYAEGVTDPHIHKEIIQQMLGLSQET